ncbi:hypothetical protein G7067_06775 [Leucobacter insecticola]|uniref:Uncharacterized protein n=1 Tax=Leucobacter insecticola TaxID=2714934 RepID=A0A6G8FIB5_9MICO|nr:hypothetical protein [Leucobacter insecticola]QIM16190.1 hypothetical protein G7067_06775 [Leucobacter insecticola]
MIENTLKVAQKSSYASATRQLSTLKSVCESASAPHDFDFAEFLAELVEQNRRRPACLRAFSEQRLI